MATNKYFKCPYCDKKFTREDLCRHLEKKHLDELPEGFTPLRVTFHVVNRKDMSYRRPCRVCKQPTEWDEVKGRYNFLCGSRQCYETHVEKMRSDMGDKIGINRQTATAEGLEKMLAGRRISGKYKFRDGHEVNYTGSYELKALEFFDKIMYIKPEDLMVPGPALKYELDGVDHIYIPDMYYIPYNLIIEVKTGGNKPNTNPQWKETRRKQMAKEKFVVEKTDYNYIRLTNNEFNQILSVFADLKMSSMEDDPYRVVHINEGNMFNTKDIYYNKDKFDSGEINLCFITGHSGSGKSTMAKNMAIDEIEYYELDDVIFNKEKFSMENFKEYGDLIYNFFNTVGKKYFVTAKECRDGRFDNINYEKELITKFIDYSINYAKSHKNNKFVIEGIWLYLYIEPEKLKDCAVYIKGTSALISRIRATKRDFKNMEDKSIKNKLNYIKNNIGFILDEKYIKKYRNYFSPKVVIEHVSSISPMIGMNDTIIVNYRQNNAFSSESKLAISDSPTFDSIFTTDTDNKLIKLNKSFLSECKYSTYILKDSKDRINSILKEGEEVVDLYEAIFNHKQYTIDQIYFEKGIVPYEDIYNKALFIEESIYDYIRNGDETDV